MKYSRLIVFRLLPTIFVATRNIAAMRSLVSCLLLCLGGLRTPVSLAQQAEVFEASLTSGTIIGRHIFGLARDYQNDPVIIDGRPLIYESQTSDTKLAVEDKAFTLSLFNHSIGSIFLTLHNEMQDGLVDTAAVELASVSGITHPDAVTQTPWNTILFSESRNIDAAAPDEFVDTFKSFFKNKADLVNPYNYGWVNEAVILDAKGQVKVIKNYAVGRVFADELVLMPDQKTLYMLDANHSGNLYVFVSEEAGSFTKGTLFAGQLLNSQMQWQKLGANSSLRVKFKLKKAAYAAFLSNAEVTESVCPAGYKLTQSAYGTECLKVVKKNRRYVGLFEPARTAAMAGINGFGIPLKQLAYKEGGNGLVALTMDGDEISFPFSSDVKHDSSFILEAPK